MATKSRRKTTGLIERLYKESWRFNFFQAVRLIQNAFAPRKSAQGVLEPVGSDAAPTREMLSFSTPPSMVYSSSDVLAISADKDQGRHQMKVGFMGVAGTFGALPSHYTEFMLQRQRAKDTAMRDFYDLFNHRAVSLFYRAWQKHRLPFSYEAHNVHGRSDRTDSITNAMLALVGRRVTDSDTAASVLAAQQYLYFGGVYASAQRSSVGLAELLCECFKVPVDIEQFVGEWGDLGDDDFVVLGCATGGQNNQLGRNTIIGKRAYCIESRFRIIIGPLSKQEFNDIKPGSQALHALCEFARDYVGPNVKFDIKMILDMQAAAPTRLGTSGTEPSNLGWNTWLINRKTPIPAHKMTEINLPSHGL